MGKNIFESKWLILDYLDNREFCLFRRKDLDEERNLNGRRYTLKGATNLTETIQREIDLGNYDGRLRMTKRARIELEYHNAK